MLVAAVSEEAALGLGEGLRGGLDGLFNEWLDKLSWDIDRLNGGGGKGGLGLSPDTDFPVDGGVGLSDGLAVALAKGGSSGFFDNRLAKRSIRRD